MQEGYSARELSAISRSSPSSIRRIIRYWLSQSPPRDDAQWRARLSQCRHVIVDGTILRRKSGEAVYAVMESNSHELLYGGYGIREGARDLQWVYGMLAQAGLHPNSATIDGNPQQARYLGTSMASGSLATVRGPRSTPRATLVSEKSQTDRRKTSSKTLSRSDHGQDRRATRMLHSPSQPMGSTLRSCHSPGASHHRGMGF